jgi:hypothetical protein
VLHVVGGRLCLAPNVLVAVSERVLDHFARNWIEMTESTRQVPEAQDGVPANVEMAVSSKLEADRRCPRTFIRVKSDREHDAR